MTPWNSDTRICGVALVSKCNTTEYDSTSNGYPLCLFSCFQEKIWLKIWQQKQYFPKYVSYFFSSLHFVFKYELYFSYSLSLSLPRSCSFSFSRHPPTHKKTNVPANVRREHPTLVLYVLRFFFLVLDICLYSYIWLDWLIYVTGRIYTYLFTQINISSHHPGTVCWAVWFNRVRYVFIHMCDMTHLFVRHDSCTYIKIWTLHIWCYINIHMHIYLNSYVYSYIFKFICIFISIYRFIQHKYLYVYIWMYK